ncbi:MAG: hypothetical protein QM305_13665, partial [Bacteroidota bacterium]|nr:hypothetical protein [Bacteroidota bacterium]
MPIKTILNAGAFIFVVSIFSANEARVAAHHQLSLLLPHCFSWQMYLSFKTLPKKHKCDLLIWLS